MIQASKQQLREQVKDLTERLRTQQTGPISPIVQAVHEALKPFMLGNGKLGLEMEQKEKERSEEARAEMQRVRGECHDLRMAVQQSADARIGLEAEIGRLTSKCAELEKNAAISEISFEANNELREQLAKERAEVRISKAQIEHLSEEQRRLALELERTGNVIKVPEASFTRPAGNRNILEILGEISAGMIDEEGKLISPDYLWIEKLDHGQANVEIGNGGRTIVRAKVPVEVLSMLLSSLREPDVLERFNDEVRSKITVLGVG